MAEVYPSDNTLLNLTADTLTGVEYIDTGQAPYYLQFRKLLYRLLLAANVANGFRVYDAGGLNIGIKPGKFFDGIDLITFAGAEGVNEITLTDNANNYIWVGVDGDAHVATDRFPDASESYIRLATVVTSGGDISSITDNREQGLLTNPGAIVQAAADLIVVNDSGVVYNDSGVVHL